MAVPSLQYVSGDTVLHRLHPLSKLFVLIVMTVSVFVFGGWYVPLALISILILLHLNRDVGLRRFARVVRPLPLFLVLIVLANAFLVKNPGGMQEGFARGLQQGLRVVIVLVAAGLFITVTDPVDLSDAVLQVLSPLRKAGSSPEEFSLIVMITFSFIPLMGEEARRLRTAQAVRCGFRRGPGVIREAVPLLAPLIIGVFRRAEEIEHAMTARYYQIGSARSRSWRIRPGWADFLVCSVCLLLFVAGLYAEF